MAKTALVTGGSKGIGRKTAEYLAAAGHSIMINYRSGAQQAESFAAELADRYNVKTEAVYGDVSVKEDCEQVVSSIGGVDILIHNAGPYIQERKPMSHYSWEEWNYLVNGNLTAVFYLTKLFLPGMKKRRFSRRKSLRLLLVQLFR
jgi:3-oxoacyl-[acyl-carrier protein] reductase